MQQVDEESYVRQSLLFFPEFLRDGVTSLQQIRFAIFNTMVATLLIVLLPPIVYGIFLKATAPIIFAFLLFAVPGKCKRKRTKY